MSRQDYIARVRYQNGLPAPPAAPRFKKAEISLDGLLSAGAISSLALLNSGTPDYDKDLGMPLDLSRVPEVFGNDAEARTAIAPSHAQADLHPDDLALLVEPSASGGHGSTGRMSGQPSVAFLRRTEYISGELVRAKRKEEHDAPLEETKPEDALARVEESFKAAAQPLSTLKHPKNPEAKAVRSWALLPDTKLLDLDLKSVRAAGSASLEKRRDDLGKRLNAAVFKTSHALGDEWATVLIPGSEEEADRLLERTNDVRDTIPAQEAQQADDQVFLLEKVMENEIATVAASRPADEVAITLCGPAAYYVPLNARVTLRRRRAEARRATLLAEHSLDDLELRVREPTAEESNARDAARSHFDPVTYS